MARVLPGDTCACGLELRACPRCGEPICIGCDDWRSHHSFRGWFGRNWRRHVSKWFIP